MRLNLIFMKRFAFLLLLTLPLVIVNTACDSSATEASTDEQAPMVMANGTPPPPQDDSYKIDIEVENFQGDTAFLAVRYGSSNRLRDTVQVTNGKFTFEGDTAMSGGMYMVVFPPLNTFFEIIIDRDQHFSVKTDTSDLTGNLQIEGSEENKIMYDDIRLLAAKRPEAMALREKLSSVEEGSAEAEKIQVEMAEIDSTVIRHRRNITEQYGDWLYGKFINTMKEPTVPENITDQDEQFWWYKKHYFDNVDFADARLLHTVALDQKMTNYLENLTFREPDSINASIDDIVKRAEGNDEVFQYVVPTLLNKYIESKMMGYDGIYVHMVEKYYLSGKAWWADSAALAKMEERAVALSPNLIGRPAPDFAANDLNGQTKSLYSMPGKWTILYFWDYDCSHCKTVTPELARVYDKFKNEDISLFTVSINGTIDIWKQKINDYKFTAGTHVADPARSSGFDKMYDLRSTPRVFVLDENKIIRYKSLTMEQLEDVLNHELEAAE